MIGDKAEIRLGEGRGGGAVSSVQNEVKQADKEDKKEEDKEEDSSNRNSDKDETKARLNILAPSIDSYLGLGRTGIVVLVDVRGRHALANCKMQMSTGVRRKVGLVWKKE
jgi:hypothetical protein